MKKLSTVVIILFCSVLNLRAIQNKGNMLFTAQLNSAQVIPSTSNPSKGLASVMLNKSRDTIYINASFVGLSGLPTSIGIYQGEAGSAGTLLVDLSASISDNKLLARLTGANVSGNMANLMKENLYLQVGTAANPNGEMRGQIRMETDWSFVTDLRGMETIPMIMGPGYGLGSFILSKDKSKLSYKIVCKSLSSSITSAKLHFGAIGNVGTMATDLSNTINGNWMEGTIPTSPAILDSLWQGAIYLNIGTALHSTGELRSQLVNLPGVVFDASADGNQMVPTIATPAKAVSVIRLVPSLDTLYYDVVADGISTTIDYAHLHVGTIGLSYGALFVDFTPTIVGNRVKGKISSGLSALVKLRLFTSTLTLIVHTAAHPTGEIRGHLKRLAREGFTMNLSGAQVVPAVSTAAYGTGIISVDMNDENAYYNYLAGNLSSSAVGVQFNKAKLGQNGAMVYNVTSGMVATANQVAGEGFWYSTAANPFTIGNGVQLSKDSIYLEVRNTTFPNGEVRGQVGNGFIPAALLSSIKEKYVETSEISISPNPSQDFIDIQMDNSNSKVYSVSIKNSQGKEVYKEVMQNKNTRSTSKVNLSDLSSGVYIVQIMADKSVFYKKLIKE